MRSPLNIEIHVSDITSATVESNMRKPAIWGHRACLGVLPCFAIRPHYALTSRFLSRECQPTNYSLLCRGQ